MINRIKEIAQYYSLSPAAFADRIEVSRPVISHIFSERNKPSMEVIQKIGNAFPDLQLEWLLYGNGGMLKKVAKTEEKPESKRETVSEVISDTEKNFAEKSAIKNPEASVISDQKPARKVAIRIVVFYQDNTFEEFNPVSR